jgi:hypothetical protein
MTLFDNAMKLVMHRCRRISCLTINAEVFQIFYMIFSGTMHQDDNELRE